MKCSKCQAENPEVAKFCIQCGAPIEFRCPGCGSVTPTSGIFCMECGRELGPPKETQPVDQSEPLSYTPKHLTEKILTTRGSLEGERKLVTVLFADVANYTSLSEKLDPEEVHQVMDGCFQILMDEIHRRDGTINQFTGDGVMALFGAPVAHEDHAQRACHAALAIQRAIAGYGEKIEKECGVEFKMRIGLNSGPVIVGSIGDDLRMDYTAVGDTTNLASRMESLAATGSVFVSDHTQRLAGEFFAFEPLGPLAVKGKEAPVETYQLLRPTEVETRLQASATRGLTPFVGRKNSLATLQEAFALAKAGAGQVVGLVGEAGVGKSRLLLEFIQSLLGEGITYLEGRCIQYGETLSYFPFIEIVKKLCEIQDTDREYVYRKKLKDTVGELDPAIETTLPFLEDFLSLKVEDPAFRSLQPDQRKWKTIEAVKALLLGQSQERPLVLVVDDLHWIDKSSEELLDRLIEGVPRSQTLLICAYRPEYRHRWGELSYFTRLGLDELSPTSSAQLVEAILRQGTVAEDVRDLVLGKSGGNPLFVEELTQNLVDVGAIGRSGDTLVLTRHAAEIPVPNSLQAVIAARMDRLEDTLKRTLQVASVIGREFAFRVLNGILEAEGDLRRHLGNLLGLEFIYEKQLFPELEYVFKHALTQDVAYNSLLLQRRKELHRQTAEAIEALYAEKLPEVLGLLAHHYYKGEAWEKALQYLTAAAERARETYATREAIEHFNKAIEIVDRVPEVPNDQLMRLYGSRGRVRQVLQDNEHAASDLEHELELARELDNKKQQTRALTDLSRCYMAGGGLSETDKAETYLNEALSMIRQTGDKVGEVRWLYQAGWLEIASLGKTSEALIHLEQGAAIARQLGDKRGLAVNVGYLALAHSFTGDYRDGGREVEEAAAFAKEVGNQFLLVSTKHWRLMHLVGLGRYQEALDASYDLAVSAREIGSAHLIALVPNHVGWIFNQLGNYGKAIQHNKDGVDLSQRYQDPEAEIFSLLNLISDHIGLEEYHTAQRYLDEVQRKRELKWYREREWRYNMHLTRYESMLSLIQDDHDLAIKKAVETLIQGQDTGAKKYVSIGWQLKGEVFLQQGQTDEATECVAKARDMAAKIENPPLMWQTAYLLGLTYKEKGRFEEARQLLLEAKATVENMASNVDDTEVKETFLTSKPVRAVYEELEGLASGSPGKRG